MFWDEDNRLMVLSDNGKTSRYTYNAGGERIIKSHGNMEGVYINGAPQGITFHETDEFTLYPASIITVNRHRFTKHYFIGDKRVASRIGQGEFRNVYGSNGSNITAGQQDYAERMNAIESMREDYYKAAGVAPGIPTMKGSYADPEVTGKGYNILIGDIGDHRVPENWVQHPVINTEAGSNPGAPLAWGSPENPDEVVAGYGYVAADTSDVEETFYYHSDHLGSTAYITDQKANVTQYDAYLPYGELLVDEHSSSADLPYKFNGKELDEETGLYYYGARYMNPVTSMWYGVDPLADKYTNVSAFAYCAGNPVKLVDVDGCDTLNLSKNENGIWDISYRQGGNRDVYYIKGQSAPVIFDSNADVSQLAVEIGDDYTLSVINVKGKSIYGYAVTPGGPPTDIAESKSPVMPGTYPLVAHNDASKWRCAGPTVMGYDLSNKKDRGIIKKDRGVRIHHAGKGPTDNRKMVTASAFTEACSVVSSSYSLVNGKVKYSPKESYAFNAKIQKSLGGIPTTYKNRCGFYYKSLNKKMQYKYRKYPM